MQIRQKHQQREQREQRMMGRVRQKLAKIIQKFDGGALIRSYLGRMPRTIISQIKQIKQNDAGNLFVH